MRKLKLQVQMTIDGFIASPNGELDWAVWNWDNEIKKYVDQITEPVDCILLGRVLAQGFIPYWAANPQQEGADKFNSTRKVVFTKTLNKSEWDNTVLAKGDLYYEITKLKNEQGKDLIVYGGGAIVSALINLGVIDEYHLFINPTAIGNGMPIFKALGSKLNLTLKKSIAFDCGIVVNHYEPTGN